MNTIKSIVVISTLLAVGYGAHFVLKQQPLGDRFDTADGVWQDLQPSTTTPSADLNGMNQLRPRVELPELAQSPLNSVRSQVTPPASDGTPGLLPVQAAQASTPLSADSGDIQSQTLADLRRQSSGALSRVVAETKDGVAPAAASFHQPPQTVVPAVATAPASVPHLPDVQPAHVNLPLASEPAALQPVPPLPAGQPPATHQPLASPAALPGYAAAGVIPPSSGTNFDALWASAGSDIQAGNYAAALTALSPLYRDRQLSVSQRDQLVTMLDQLAGSVIYSPEPHLLPAHTVQPGETLATLAAQHGLSEQFLARVNGIASNARLAAGTQLKVISGPFRAEISLADREITLFVGDLYAGRFSCAIGRDLPAQVKQMSVVSISGARSFVDFRTGEKIEPGAPNNPYGNHWIELAPVSAPATSGLGIHSVGTAINASDTRGCVSVSAAEAADLAAILSPGSRIAVVP